MKSAIEMTIPIDMHGSEVRSNPYPAYALLRSMGRAVYDKKSNLWFVGNYDDVVYVLKDAKLFSNREAGFETTLHGRDGLLHMETRKKLTPAFQMSMLEGMSAAIDRKAEETVDNLLQKSTQQVEVVTRLSGIVPLAVFGWMFGTSFNNLSAFRRWTDSIITSGRNRLPTGRWSPWLHRLQQLTRGRQPDNSLIELHECETWLRSLFQGASHKVQGGWMYDLLETHLRNGSLNIEEIIDIGLIIVVAATETTTSTIANAIYHLSKMPHLQEQLRAHPELLETFVEELLRFDGPIQRRPRYVTEPTTIGDAQLKEGDLLMLLIGSANRDPAQFPDADTFIIDRNPNKHLAFGAGSHFCLGSQLARMEVKAALRAVLANTTFFSMSDPEQPIEHPKLLQIRGPRKLFADFQT